MFRVHGEVKPVGPDQEGGRIVIVLLESRFFSRHPRFSPCLISRVSIDTTCAKNLALLAFLPFCLTGTTILNNVHHERQTTKTYGINRR